MDILYINIFTVGILLGMYNVNNSIISNLSNGLPKK